MSRDRARATPRNDTEETRRAILRAAHDLFMDLGYRAVTTRMVAEASGVKQPLIYYHFTDKEALYLEVQREEAAACKAALERIAGRHSETVPERLLHVAHFLRRSRQQNMGMFLHELRYEMRPEVRAAMRELFVISILGPIVSIFEEGISAGVLRSPEQGGASPRLAAHLLLSAVSSLSEMPKDDRMHDRGEIWGENHDPVDTVVDVLINGMIHHPNDASCCTV